MISSFFICQVFPIAVTAASRAAILEREAADLRDPGALRVEVFLSREIRPQGDLAVLRSA